MAPATPEGVTLASITPADYETQFAASGAEHLLVDVRTPEEFAEGHIPGAVNISVQTLPDRLNEIPRDIPVVVYCRSGNRSGQASQILAQAGYETIYDLGAITAWQAAGLPIQ
ncbi:MAG: rhodanese-like domain-containing protein [Anaerolineae bacterium]|nr:rhodanese-like domain-containing protein [Anaerolineae bacterium]